MTARSTFSEEQLFSLHSKSQCESLKIKVDDHGETTLPTSSTDNFNEDSHKRSLIFLHKALRQETLYNVESYKKSRNDLTSTDRLLYAAFCELYDHLENIDGVLLDILDLAPNYDFKNHKVNGYRSLVKVTQSCLTHLTALVRHISVNRDSYIFRASHYAKELESYVMVLGQLRDVLHYTRKLMNYTPKGQLMPPESLLDTAVGEKIQMEMDMIDQECFYGRALGFQVCIAKIFLATISLSSP